MRAHQQSKHQSTKWYLHKSKVLRSSNNPICEGIEPVNRLCAIAMKYQQRLRCRFCKFTTTAKKNDILISLTKV
jgi:hypothetical protein